MNGEKLTWWMLATAHRFYFPVKGRAEAVIKKDNEEDKIDYFAFYPLDMKMVEKLEVV